VSSSKRDNGVGVADNDAEVVDGGAEVADDGAEVVADGAEAADDGAEAADDGAEAADDGAEVDGAEVVGLWSVFAIAYKRLPPRWLRNAFYCAQAQLEWLHSDGI
jgi:hypothetical protein